MTGSSYWRRPNPVRDLKISTRSCLWQITDGRNQARANRCREEDWNRLLGQHPALPKFSMKRSLYWMLALQMKSGRLSNHYFLTKAHDFVVIMMNQLREVVLRRGQCCWLCRKNLCLPSPLSWSLNSAAGTRGKRAVLDGWLRNREQREGC